MGLMQGLTSLDFSTAEGTITSIPTLLSGMRFAFATSVAGIACSLTFNMFNRMSIGRAVRALDGFEDAFYELAMPRPLQPDVQLMCQKQDEDARAVRLAENVGSQISASIEMAVGRAMQPLTQSLDTFIQGATHEQVEGVQRIVGQFVRQMNASLGSQLTALGDTMRAVNDGQMQTQRNLQNTLEISKALARDAENIRKGSADIAENIQLIAAELRLERERRAENLTTVDDSSQQMAARLEALSQSLEQMQAAVDSLTANMNERQQ